VVRLVVLLMLAAFVARLLAQLIPRRPAPRSPQRARRATIERPAEALVACCACGVLTPCSRSLHAAGRTYCSSACRDALPHPREL
jgi:hypothetical protein